MIQDECFVIAPIGELSDEKRKRTDQVFKYIIQKALEGKYQAVLAHKIGKPGKISMHIIEKLATVPLLIADLTDHNANVYYELALRHALNMPAVLLIEESQRNNIPFDLKDMRVITYNLHDPGKIDDAARELTVQIGSLENDPAMDWHIFPEEISLTLEPNGPENQKVLLGSLLIANRIRHELIEPYFEGLLDLESRNRKLKFTFQQLMRECARKEYLQRKKILWAFTNLEYKNTVGRLFDEVESIIPQLVVAIASDEEGAIKKQLSNWRINNTRYLQTWVKQYEASLLELNVNIDETPENPPEDRVPEEAANDSEIIEAVFE